MTANNDTQGEVCRCVSVVQDADGAWCGSDCSQQYVLSVSVLVSLSLVLLVCNLMIDVH